MQTRQYQEKLKSDIYTAWDNGARNICAVLPTGGGKTKIFSDIMRDHVGASVAVAHRQELVGQISAALAINNVKHKIIAPNDVIRWIIKHHVYLTGQSFYDPNAHCAVAGVDTLIRRTAQFGRWMDQVSLWVTDEAHHLTAKNKWGQCVDLLPNAKGLGVTATPLRADGKGLGRHADGVFDQLITGPGGRELIDMGYLCDYRIFSPPSDLNLENVRISTSTGDYNPAQLKQQVRKSHIIGDVVDHYMRIAPGKQGVTFATDIETAKDIAAQFKSNGVAVAIITGKTPGTIRVEMFRRFSNKEIQQLINVDIVGEGIDIPGIEVVSMARPTESYGLFVQQFGRALRILPGKERAVIIDHVGNTLRHGLPDASREWTLDRRERGAKSVRDPNIIPLRQCLNPECVAVYEAIYNACPFCGNVYMPPGRNKPEFVDGDLLELDADTLSQMRGEIEKMKESPEHMKARMLNAGAPPIAAAGAAKNQKARQEGQELVRESIAWWVGHQEHLGREQSEIYRRFYFGFGMDMLSAQTLSAKESKQLAVTINKSIDELVNMR